MIGPRPVSRRPRAARRRSFHARSSRTAPTPSSANSASIVSSSATRLSTIALPSIASSPPAITASRVERNSRCAISIVTSTSRMPLTATAIRQPNGSSAPNSGEAERDDPLAERRVRDERRGVEIDLGMTGVERRVGVGRPRSLVAEVRQRVGVLDVVGLVEDEFVRMAEPDQPGQRGDEQHDRGAAPLPGAARAGTRHQILPAQSSRREPASSMTVTRPCYGRACAHMLLLRRDGPCSSCRRRSATSAMRRAGSSRRSTNAEVIAAEDTRTTVQLLRALGDREPPAPHRAARAQRTRPCRRTRRARPRRRPAGAVGCRHADRERSRLHPRAGRDRGGRDGLGPPRTECRADGARRQRPADRPVRVRGVPAAQGAAARAARPGIRDPHAGVLRVAAPDRRLPCATWRRRSGPTDPLRSAAS